MDQAIRNKLRNVVTQSRRLLEEAVSQVLQGQFGVYATGKKGEVQVEDAVRMGHLSEEDRGYREQVLVHFGHIQARGFKPADALDQLIREVAFTHLNRLCAYKMMERRGLIREAVSRGIKSQGFLFYLADNPEDERRATGGEEDLAYKHFLQWLGETLSEEIGVLFSPTDPANRLFPPQRVLDEVLLLINGEDLKDIWTVDETIGWVYQFFTPKELRDQVRKESQAPRNSYEMAFRNQFFTPRYVVEFLVDNTLGRIWYEMRKGRTRLKDECRYLINRPNEVFLTPEELAPDAGKIPSPDLTQEETLYRPVSIPHRALKDPREIKVLDPACGSAHFLLYCFALLFIIYEEAYDDAESGTSLKRDYPTHDDFRKAIPGLILSRNLHGIDIDPRAVQIAALALWLRAQRAYQDLGLKRGERPIIKRTNIVCAEPMPGEDEILDEFLAELQPPLLGQLVKIVYRKMKLAGEAGSLLKIEEELQGAILKSKQQWQSENELATDREGHRLLFSKAEMERIEGDKPGIALFDVQGMTDDQFWEEAEDRVIDALQDYARRATDAIGLRRRLFAEDSERGFSFIEICRKKFDAVLMNPPFGATSLTSKSYIVEQYPDWGNDVFIAFARRAVELGGDFGAVGAITSRLAFFLSSFGSWREEFILPKMRVSAFADLGYGVLDEALVEVAAWALIRPKHDHMPSSFVSLLDSKDKELALGSLLSCKTTLASQQNCFLVHQSSFSILSGSPFCYWVSDSIRLKIGQHKSVIAWGGEARKGLNTSDDERFLRAAWEVAPSSIGPRERWVYLAKGGEYTPFYDDIHLVVDWSGDGVTLASSGADIRNPSCYFNTGLTYSSRSTSGFNIKLLPLDCIFSTGGHGFFTGSEESLLVALALLSSRTVGLQIEMAVGSGDEAHSGSAARNYLNGMVNNLRLPLLSASDRSELKHLALLLLEEARHRTTSDETSRFFVFPAITPLRGATLRDCVDTFVREEEDRDIRLVEAHHRVDHISSQAFGFTDLELSEIDREMGRHVGDFAFGNPSQEQVSMLFSSGISELILRATELAGSARYLTKKAFVSSRRLELISRILDCHPRQVVDARRRSAVLLNEDVCQHSDALISYSLGCVLGRWDCRLAIGNRVPPALPSPFSSLPSCSPGMIRGSDPPPLLEVPEDFPLDIDSDGILVDDPDHPDDIVRRIRDVLELFWKDRAEAIEREACEILGVSDLRDYARKPGNGGLWMDHVSRYSKSRRKAPIYWLLQSSKRNYALWLYYHRLDKDLLFKALLNYVEPKVRLEESRLEPLRAQRAEAGTSGKSAKGLEKQIEKQEALLSELQDFEAKLRRAAELHLEPDLNDGVVLNIAPLRELVPWREAKLYWDELVAGKYEWSSIGKQLLEKGLVK